MESQLSLEFLRVVEQAAIASAHTMGLGDRHKADDEAVKAMRATMDTVGMDGTIVIGEGERDEAPMLYIGEKVGAAQRDKSRTYPAVDIAVDPLEGTNLCATGEPNSIATLAASERGGLLHAPDLYMEKIIVGPSCKGAVELDATPSHNLHAIARRLDREVEDLVVIVLDRPRHEKFIADIRATGARIRLIGDGDLSAGISAAVVGTGVHAVMGTGGAPEGVSHRGGTSLFEWANSGAACDCKTGRRRAAGANGSERSETNLRSGRSRAGPTRLFSPPQA